MSERTFTLDALETILYRRMERAETAVEAARQQECYGLVARYEAIRATCCHLLKEVKSYTN